MTPNFDVVIIARNESKTLPRLAASLKEFLSLGGNWVVVDTGSTDGTPDVARSLGAQVTEVGDRFRTVITDEEAKEINSRFIVENDEPILHGGDTLFRFSDARNFAASLAKNDFIFMPDADECFTAFNIEEIQKGIDEGVQQYEYEFVFAHDSQGRPTIQFFHSKAYDRRVMKWSGVVHEILKGDAKRRFLPKNVCYLEHFQNQETNRSGYLKGLAYAMLGEGAAESPDRASHYFARELFYTRRFQSAIREFQRHIAMNAWAAERSQSYVFIGQCYEAIGDTDRAVDAYHAAFRVDASRREPFIRLAYLYLGKNDHQRVACYAEAALQIPMSNFYANDAASYRHIPHELLYWAHFWMGNKEKARFHWEEAFKFWPSNPKFIHESQFFVKLPTVSFVIPTLGRPEGLKKCLESIEKLNYPKELIDIQVLAEPEPTVPQKVKQGVDNSKGDFVCYMANDTEMTPDSLKIAILSSIVNKKGLVAFHSEEVYPDLGNVVCHFVIRRDLISKLEDGEVFSTRFWHYAVDNWLHAQCVKLNEFHHENEAQIIHNHYSKGAEFDWVYKRATEHVQEDRALLKIKLAELETRYENT